MQKLVLAPLTAVAVLSLASCADDLPLESDRLESASPVATSHAMAPMRSSVHWLSDLSTVEGSGAQLKRTKSAVSFSLRTTGLEKDHVVTVWWVIFNNPEECTNPIPAIGANCNVPDLFDEDVAGSVMWATGNLVGQSGSSAFGGYLAEGEVTTFHPVFVGSPGLLDAMGAEIHLVVRTHGPRIPSMVKEMRTTFEGACTPGSSLGFGDGPNSCEDIQAAAFPAP